MRKFLSLILLATCAAFPAHAQSLPTPLILTVGAAHNAPDGYVDFCSAYPHQCVAQGSSRPQRLTDAKWGELQRINLEVNRSIEPKTDRECYHKDEVWTMPSEGCGDCEDYVLLKRKILGEHGWPTSDLLVTVVFDERGDGHAVLLVRTTIGELILDNKTNIILHWFETRYHFLYRQSVTNPNQWVSLGDPRSYVAQTSAVPKS